MQEVDGNGRERFLPTPSDYAGDIYAQSLAFLNAKKVDTNALEDLTAVFSKPSIGRWSGYVKFGSLNGTDEFTNSTVKLNVSKTQVEVPEMFLRKVENMFWPCHDKKSPCTPEAFFKSVGISRDYKAQVDLQYKLFCKHHKCNFDDWHKNC